VPEDHVVDQDPLPDGRVVEGGTITLTTSLGPDRREVPEVVGRTREQAVAALEGVGLASGAATEAFSDLPVGAVVATDPEQGAPLPPGTEVTLVLSKGVEMLGVPDVRGAQRADAERAITQAGFTPAVTEVFSEDVGKGLVAGQGPVRGPRRAQLRGRARGQQGTGARHRPRRRRPGPRGGGAALEAAGSRCGSSPSPGPGRVRSTDPGRRRAGAQGLAVTMYVF
jgi:serine/threonine-protein kinase